MKGTIKSKAEVERFFREGKRSSCFMCTVLVLPAAAEVGRCAFIAGKKLGAAPVRARCKRVMREVARELGPFPADVVFIAKAPVGSAPHSQVVLEMRRVLQRAGVL